MERKNYIHCDRCNNCTFYRLNINNNDTSNGFIYKYPLLTKTQLLYVDEAIFGTRPKGIIGWEHRRGVTELSMRIIKQ